MRRRPLELVEAAVAGILWAALVAGMSVTVLTAPEYTAILERSLGIPATAGLSSAETLELAGRVRDFVAAQDPGTLPSLWRGRPAFDTRAVSHLVDVRRVLMAARVATGAAAGLLAAFLMWCVARHRRRPLADSMRVGAIGVGVILAGALAVGLGDFDAFFAGFHGLFFASGTWTFSYDSLLIRLFPERFWVTAGASWGALAALGAVVLALTARYIGAGVAEDGSIRTAEDV